MFRLIITLHVSVVYYFKYVSHFPQFVIRIIILKNFFPIVHKMYEANNAQESVSLYRVAVER